MAKLKFGSATEADEFLEYCERWWVQASRDDDTVEVEDQAMIQEALEERRAELVQS